MLKVVESETFRAWLAGLRDVRGRAIIAGRLLRLAGGLAGDVKSVGDQVSELRIHFGPGYRVYFTRRGERLIVVLAGGDKDSQDRDIAAAKALAAEFDQGDRP